MQSFIVTKEWIPPVYDKVNKIIKVGYRVVELSIDSYQVLDQFGREKFKISRDILLQLNKRPLAAPGQLTIMQEIGIQLRKAREARGLSLEQLAQKIRATRQYLNRVELGKGSCSMEQLKRICDALNFDLKIKITRSYERETSGAD
jgi:ribosome-binding protein aMBF1 (putative translation factor)